MYKALGPRLQRPNPKSLIGLIGRQSRLWQRVKGDSGCWHRVAHGKCVGVDSGVDMRGGYSQLRQRVRYAMFFFEFGLSLVCGVSKLSVFCLKPKTAARWQVELILVTWQFVVFREEKTVHLHIAELDHLFSEITTVD